MKLNDAPDTIAELNDLPIKTVNGATIFMRDVAHVRDGSPPQQSIVHVDGRRAVLMTDPEDRLGLDARHGRGRQGQLLPQARRDPAAVASRSTPLNDQSMFVKAAISGVVREGVIAAALTSLMILLFLGSWRSTVIIATSIPLAVLSR